MSGLDGGGYRLLGVTIDGPAPLGRIHFDLCPGLSFLYGLNGAGKTRVLVALAAALQGHAIEGGHGIVHLQVDDVSAAPKEGFLGALFTGLRVGAAFSNEWEPSEETFAFEEEASARLDRNSSFERIVEQHLLGLDSSWEHLEVAHPEAAASGYFSLQATGTATHPQWQIWISDCIRSDSPLAQAYKAVGPLVRAGEALQQQVQDWPKDDHGRPLPQGSQPELLQLVETMIENLKAISTSSPWDLGHPALRDLTTKGGRLFRKTDSVVLHDHGRELVERLEQSATESFRSLIGPGSELRFELGSPERWFLGAPPAWVCDNEYDRGVPIDQLDVPQALGSGSHKAHPGPRRCGRPPVGRRVRRTRGRGTPDR